jgi:hypothetical protein
MYSFYKLNGWEGGQPVKFDLDLERYTLKDVPFSWNGLIAIMIHFIVLFIGL